MNYVFNVLLLMVTVLLFMEPLLGVWYCTKYITYVILFNSLDSFRSKEAKVELELRSSGCKACIHPIVSGLFF